MNKSIIVATVAICLFGLSPAAMAGEAVRCKIVAAREDKVIMACTKPSVAIKVGTTVMVRRLVNKGNTSGEVEGC